MCVLRKCAEATAAFEFAIGWPDLKVQLTMPRDLLEQFPHEHPVVRLRDEDASPRLGERGRDGPFGARMTTIELQSREIKPIGEQGFRQTSALRLRTPGLAGLRGSFG